MLLPTYNKNTAVLIISRKKKQILFDHPYKILSFVLFGMIKMRKMIFEMNKFLYKKCAFLFL